MKDIANNPIHNPAILAKIDEADVATNENADEVANEENKQAKQNEFDSMTNQYFNSDNSIAETMFV